MSFIFDICRKVQSKHIYLGTTDNRGKKEVQEYSSQTKFQDIQNQLLSLLKIKKSDYQELKIQLRKENKKWTDPQFPPNGKSLGQFDHIDPQNCQWRRISEIIKHPELFDDLVEPSDVISGTLDKCYFLSSLAALAQDQKRILKIFQGQQFSSQGLYKLKLRIQGQIKQILVDDYIPVNKKTKKPLFCQPKKNEFWVMIMQKAWAKLKGSYEKMQYGNPTQVFQAVTYAPSQVQPVNPTDSDKDRLWKKVVKQLQQKNPICCGTLTDPTQQLQHDNKGLVWGHYYTVVDAAVLRDKHDSKQFTRILKLRNPWGKYQWLGQCSQKDIKFWDNTAKSIQKERLWNNLQKQDDGTFFIRWIDFCKFFDTLHFCYYVSNPFYEDIPIYPDGKHGEMFVLNIKKEDNYIIQIHQTQRKRDKSHPDHKKGIEDSQINRATLLILAAKNYQFLDGSFTYDEYDTIVRLKLYPGKYLIFAKVDPTVQHSLMPKKVSLSCYSHFYSQIKHIDRDKVGKDFYRQMFIPYARANKQKTFENGKMWISWKQFLAKAGYAYIAFGVEVTSRNKFVVSFNQEDFNDNNYELKKPHKGKGKIHFQVKTGDQYIVIARVMKGEKKVMKFPPPMKIEIQQM